jgi:hypothetical protein
VNFLLAERRRQPFGPELFVMIKPGYTGLDWVTACFGHLFQSYRYPVLGFPYNRFALYAATFPLCLHIWP